MTKFELRAEHRVTANSSQYELGAALLQRKRGEQWQPVVYISRRLTEAVRRYAQLEKETLAITWGREVGFLSSRQPISDRG